MARVEVVIEELVLDGFDRSDGARIGDAVQAELMRILAERGLGTPSASIALDHLSAGSFAMQQNATPRAVGREVARSLHTSIRRGING